MVLSEFFEYVDKYKWASYVGMEDYADKLSFNVSTSLLLLFTLIIAMKSYFFESISCYIPIRPSGKNFEEYLKSYCWVHGTIPLFDHESPNTDAEWLTYDTEKRINYYQWVPFMLGLQAILFYLPRIIWQITTYNLSGTDLEAIVRMASEATNKVGESKRDSVSQIAENLASLLFGRRKLNLHSNKIASKYSQAKNTICFGKRSGRRLVFQYMIIKLLYLINVFGQLFLMQKFLGFGHNEVNFGYLVLNNIIKGKEWNDTMIFPRVTYCYLDKIQHVRMSNDYLAQCVLPINMLNEKIYIFLWFWMVIVLFFSLISFFQWIVRILRSQSQLGFLKKFLKLREMYTDEEKDHLSRFKKGFLRGDGVFITRMLSINAGDLITTEIVSELWRIFKDKHANDNFNKPGSTVLNSIVSDASTLPLKQEFL